MSAGVNRLPAPAGLLLDRERPISFRFEGETYRGLAGDTLASALAANGEWLLSRSFKYHRPRGVLTMAGQDANTLVQLKGEPNVPADRLAITEGLESWGQNYSGSLKRDRDVVMGLAGRFMPVGFYYRAFFKPRGIWEKFWEPIVRRKAGLGRVDLDTPHGYFDKAYGFYDLAVIGGGPAGLAAGLAAAEAGAEVLLVEENPVLGGSLTYARFDVEGTLAEAKRAELVAAVAAQAKIEVMTDAVCNGWFADNWLPVIRGNRLYKVRAKEAILASGAIEQPAVFRNNDLPGVMQGSAAQRLIRLYGVKPGSRAVVMTANEEGYGVALDLLDAGVEVAAVAELRHEPGPSALAKAVATKGVPVIAAHGVSEAYATRGKRGVKGARLAPSGAAGQAGHGGRDVDCDLICMSPGYTPTYQLALQAGGKLGYDDDSAFFSITGLPEHFHLAGSVDGAFDLEAVLAGGRLAGWRAAKALGLEPGPEPAAPGANRSVNHPWPIIPHKDGKDFVDFDEDLQVKDIVNAVADGYDELELVKRFSTVGMGPSQGRHSALATARLVARETERKVAEIGVTTARPPFTGEQLGVLGGRVFEPERLTAMHHRHLEQGAQMMTAGLWWRPAYYGPKAEREAAIREEALAVRQNVAMIDVSTLGGLEVRGPDAAEFLERMYTFAYKKQPLGRSRYVLMTNDAGTVIDDGVACRLREDHFYVTATTGGVDRVYRTMLWWNAQWRLDVDVANVTAAYAGVNIAGPRSRQVLERLAEDVDLSAEAFPYMGLREGRVAGIPARLMRVGFVGELGYEIHLPASQGEALWDRLTEAGKDHGLRPFGVEAQRMLRLEKGHIIIGQDTDAMTTPDEVDMAWAIAKKKAFFVGGRSIELRRRHPSKRKLVGFTLEDPGAPLPEESNLVLRDGEMVGFITSVARSPALDKVIGLAYTAADKAEPGQALRIKLTSGRMIEGRVSAPHFYDPDNQRQEL
ncbi:MAG: 2Fe-2S iron-sulfur cluster-binding protein [Rhodospirillales bacterium]|nr:2Fe-2S iron-sulfur cluster-binding protein [Rhodospirillales bacterium]